MRTEQLYSKTKKGDLQTWVAYTEGDKVCTEHGKLNGKIQLSKKTAKGKNIGKANETTPEEQAGLQAMSMFRKKMDKGYFLTPEEALNTIVFLPMGAHKFDEKKHNLQYPVLAQPKMNGVRCMAHWDGDTVKLLSRGGKYYNVQHIIDACTKVLPKGQVFDGELYIHGMPLGDINSLVKKPKPGSEKLEFWIYDTFYMDKLDDTFKVRFDYLLELYHDYIKFPLVKVPCCYLNKEEDVRPAEADYVKQGFEGAIVRDFRGTYELANRSDYLLKVKSFLDDEFKIIGFCDGEGKSEGCVIWECITPEGKSFEVVPKGTMEERAEWFKTGNEYIGKWLTVKFQEYSDKKIPCINTGLAIRMEEDML